MKDEQAHPTPREDLERKRVERGEIEKRLLAALKDRLPALETLREEVSGHWGYEDPVYRFYHQSFKVYFVQGATEQMVRELRRLLPGRGLNRWFEEIVASGTGKRFEIGHNDRWLEHTRPLLEAFFHARYFLEMACRYGRELDEAPRTLPSGWAALLYLYDLR